MRGICIAAISAIEPKRLKEYLLEYSFDLGHHPHQPNGTPSSHVLLPPLAWQAQTEASSKLRARECMSNTDKAFLNHAKSLVVDQYHAVAIVEPSPEIKMAQSVVMQSTVTRFAVPIYDSWMSHGLRSVRLLRLKTLYATYATCNLTMANHIDHIHHSFLSIFTYKRRLQRLLVQQTLQLHPITYSSPQKPDVLYTYVCLYSENFMSFS